MYPHAKVKELVFQSAHRYNRPSLFNDPRRTTMTTVIPIKPIGRIKLTPENKCGYCTNSTCCTYVTQNIDAPRSMEDFDMLLWQVSHHNVQLF